MIGSHDSYTYLKAKNAAMNAISGTWRTQNKTILEQYKAGAHFFDVRLCRSTENGKACWRTCHGYAEFDKIFYTIKSVCAYFRSLKGSMFRLWLEKGSDEEWELMKKEAEPLTKTYADVLLYVVRKSDSDKFWVSDKYASMQYVDYTFEKWNVISGIKALFGTPIKDYALSHNPEITQEMIDDPVKIYFMEYIGN